MRSLLKRVLPAGTYEALKIVARRVKHFGLSRYCLLCGARQRHFSYYGGRAEASCGVCGSMERHRLIWLYFQQRTNLFDGKPKCVLHIAPEWSIARALSKLAYLDYLSGDLNPSGNQQRIDITDIPYPDDSFDVIYCSHVLEHVPEDRKAMAEFFRVLKPGGWAVL